MYTTSENVPEYMVKGGTTYRFITDQVGSVRLVVEAQTGTISQRIDYDEFGNVLMNTNPDFQPFGFAGGLLDSKTRLTRFGARDYDASVGRWTAKDPILFRGSGPNLYVYGISDPLNMTDPSGKYIATPKSVILGFVGGVIGALDAYAHDNSSSALSTTTRVFQGFAIGAAAGFIGGMEFSSPLRTVAAGTFTGGVTNLGMQVLLGNPNNRINKAEAVFSAIVGFASTAYGQLLNQDLAGAAAMITIFVSIQQAMILDAVR